MPKRIGYLYEKVVDEKNCIRAVIEMTKGKQKNRKAMSIREGAERYGRIISDELANGTQCLRLATWAF